MCIVKLVPQTQTSKAQSFFDEAISNFTGTYVNWMNETLCEKKNITIFTVSDFDLCFESLIFDRNRMVNSVTYYFPGNSTFEPLSVQWNEFMNPSRYLNVRMPIQYFKYKAKY